MFKTKLYATMGGIDSKEAVGLRVRCDWNIHRYESV